MRPPIESVDPEVVRDAVSRARARVAAAAARSGRDVDVVRLLAAVKYVDSATCSMLVAAGVIDLAENRLDALAAKQDAGGLSAGDARWHFIGRLQSRQAVAIAERVGTIHSLCSASAAARLGSMDGPLPEVFVQVNVDGDPSKDGLVPADVEGFLLDLPERVTVSGFMAMPAFAQDPEASRPAFAALRELRDRLAPLVVGRHPLRSLSMGTSQDYEVAVEEGSTHVRVGRILYEHEE